MKISFLSALLIFAGLQLHSQFRCQDLKTKLSIPAPPSIDYSARSDTFNLKHFDLELDFSALPARQMTGRADITLQQLQSNGGTLTLDLLQLQVDSVWQDQQPVSFNHNDTLLQVQLQPTTPLNQDFDVTVFYHGSPPGDGSGWGGWHQQSGYYYNLGVGFAADPHPYGRAWHPCFDNFVEKTTYDFKIKTVLPLKAYANGLRTAVQTLGGDTIVSSWHMTDSIPSYLASIAISNYAEINDSFKLSQGSMPVQLIAKPADSVAMINSYRNLFPITQSFETAFGPYRWQKIGYASTTVGAMEHATSIHMPDRLIRNNSGEDIVAHELAHHWWGNLVTCETDADMWINEGMAEYCSHFYEEYVYGPEQYWETVRANQLYVLDRAHKRDNGYKAIQGLNHAYVYGAHVYQKGAMVAHNLRVHLGDSLFFTGLTQLLNQNAFGNLSSIQFRDQLSAITGVKLDHFFTDQIFNAGFASFRVDSIHNQSNATGQHQVTITIAQARHQSPRLFQDVTLQLELVDENDIHHIREIKQSGKSQTYTFSLPAAIQHVLLNYKGGQLSADTYDVFSFEKTGLQTKGNTSLAVDVKAVTDTNLRLIATQHWAGPNNAQQIPGKVSQRRFWSLVDEGGEIINADFDLRINVDGSDLGSEGDLLAHSADSLRVFYRERPSDNWKLYADADINVFGSDGNRQGWIDLRNFSFNKIVDLTLANVAQDFSNVERDVETKPFKIFPNPSSAAVTIQFSEDAKLPCTVEVLSLNGKLLDQQLVQSGQDSLQLSFTKSEEKVIVKINDFTEVVIIGK